MDIFRKHGASSTADNVNENGDVAQMMMISLMLMTVVMVAMIMMMAVIMGAMVIKVIQCQWN